MYARCWPLRREGGGEEDEKEKGVSSELEFCSFSSRDCLSFQLPTISTKTYSFRLVLLRMPALSDSDSDGDMPTLDELFKAKRKPNTDDQQPPSSSSCLVDKIKLPSSILQEERPVGAKAKVGAKQVSSRPSSIHSERLSSEL